MVEVDDAEVVVDGQVVQDGLHGLHGLRERWRSTSFWAAATGGGVSQADEHLRTTRTHLLHFDAPHGPADVNDEDDVLPKRREVGRRKELDKVSV